MTEQQQNSDDGFTLLEKLIALIILAISSGLLMQWVSLATTQLHTADRKQAAEQLALAILAERQVLTEPSYQAEGMDEGSGLYWYFHSEIKSRKAGEQAKASVALNSVEISLTKATPPLYKIATISMQAFK